ncbi:hypothetical protein GCM10008083_31080 [Ulvibacter litoralis]|nr:hypothetical protein GCM10008083_31080 [Ulvibacter litoralis]
MKAIKQGAPYTNGFVKSIKFFKLNTTMIFQSWKGHNIVNYKGLCNGGFFISEIKSGFLISEIISEIFYVNR